MLDKIFLEHPRTVGESYWQHFYQAMRFSGKMFYGAAACFIHGLVPALCTRTGSKTIAELHDCMVANRHLQTRSKAHPQPVPPLNENA